MGHINKRSIFITGASGFIGANLIRKLLKEDADVHILIRTKKIPWRLKEISDYITIHNGDLTNFSSLKKALIKAQPIYIIHLAAYGAYHFQTELNKITSVNIDGTKNLLEASRDIPYKCFINTGSSSEYGFNNKPMRENDFCDPISYYGATKLAATQICKVFAQINNKSIVTFRLFSAYGPYEEPSRFIPTIVKSLIKREEIKITPGSQRRDFTYVDDISDAFLKALVLGKKIQGEIINLGTGKEYANDEIVENLFHLVNKKTRIKKGGYPKRAWDSLHWSADISKAKKILNWQPQYDINQGLLDTYSWIRDNIKFYN